MSTNSYDLDSVGKVRAAQPQAQPRAVGAPLPTGGSGGRVSAPDSDSFQEYARLVHEQEREPIREQAREQVRELRPEPAPAAERDVRQEPEPVQAAAKSAYRDESYAVPRGRRAMNLLRMALPLMQRILPLLDGNVGTAISNLMQPQQQIHAPHPTPIDGNLERNLDRIELGLSELKTQHRDMTAQNRELREHILEQSTSMKRVEHQLEMVREATDRNTLEQQELLEDFKHLGGKVNFVAVFALVLLAASVVLNVFLYLHLQRVLP